MGSWRTRASAASVTGAFVFAAVAGAGAIFVGDWWGTHHGPVVTEFVTTPASPATSGHRGPATSVRPTATFPPAGGAAARGNAQADARTARVAGTSRAAVRAHHSMTPATLAPVTTAGGPAVGSAPATPAATGSGSAPASTPSSTDSPGTDSSTSGN